MSSKHASAFSEGWIRILKGPGYEVPLHYDSLVAKLLAHGNSREQALPPRMGTALAEVNVAGIDTNAPLHAALMQEPGSRAGGFDIHYLERRLAEGLGKESAA